MKHDLPTDNHMKIHTLGQKEQWYLITVDITVPSDKVVKKKKKLFSAGKIQAMSTAKLSLNRITEFANWLTKMCYSTMIQQLPYWFDHVNFSHLSDGIL